MAYRSSKTGGVNGKHGKRWLGQHSWQLLNETLCGFLLFFPPSLFDGWTPESQDIHDGKKSSFYLCLSPIFFLFYYPSLTIPSLFMGDFGISSGSNVSLLLTQSHTRNCAPCLILAIFVTEDVC